MKKLIGGGLVAFALSLAVAAPAQAETDCNAKPSNVIDVWLCAITANQPVPGEHAPGTNPLEVMAP